MAQTGVNRAGWRRRAVGIVALIAGAATVSSAGSASAVAATAGADAVRVEFTGPATGITLSPTSGPSSGSTTITISGPGVGDATLVIFGGSGSPYSVPVTVNANEIQVVSPPLAAGNVSVEVRLGRRDAVFVPGGFTYLDLEMPETGNSSTQISLLVAVVLLAGGAWTLRWSRASRH